VISEGPGSCVKVILVYQAYRPRLLSKPDGIVIGCALFGLKRASQALSPGIHRGHARPGASSPSIDTVTALGCLVLDEYGITRRESYTSTVWVPERVKVAVLATITW